MGATFFIVTQRSIYFLFERRCIHLKKKSDIKIIFSLSSTESPIGRQITNYVYIHQIKSKNKNHVMNKLKKKQLLKNQKSPKKKLRWAPICEKNRIFLTICLLWAPITISKFSKIIVCFKEKKINPSANNKCNANFYRSPMNLYIFTCLKM